MPSDLDKQGFLRALRTSKCTDEWPHWTFISLPWGGSMFTISIFSAGMLGKG